MAGAKKFKYRFTRHCEDRAKDGEKIIFKLGEVIELTKKEAEPFGDVLELSEDLASDDEDDSDGQGGEQ